MRKITLGLALLAASCMGPPAYAQQFCAPLATVVATAAAKFNEHPVFHGSSPSGVTMLVVASAEGTYSIFAVTPDGTACLLDAGDGAAVKLPPVGKPS